MSQQDAEQNAGFIRRFIVFLLQVRQEMDLVVRPGWEEVRSATTIVIIFVFLFAFYLRALDWILSPLDRWIFNR